MYSIREIKRGIKNPERILRELLEHGNNLRYKLINSRVSNGNKNSDIALAINWGCHKLNHWPVAEYKFFVDTFIDLHDPVIIPNQRTYDKVKNDVKSILTIETDSYMSPDIDYDISINHNILLIAGHPHPKGEDFKNHIYEQNVDYILSRYYHPMKIHFPEIKDEKIVHYPWAVPEEYIISDDDITSHRQEKISIFGRTSESPMYKDREQLRDRPSVANVRSIGTSRNSSKPLSDEEYYRWIRNFDAVIAAGAFEPQYQYTFARYFEVPAAGSLLFAQYCEDLDRLGFDENNCVTFDSIDDFDSKAEAYLSDPVEYIDRRKQGAQLIRDRHTVRDRISTIEDLCGGF